LKPYFKFRRNLGANAIITSMLFWSLLVLLLMLSNPVALIFGSKFSRLLYGIFGVLSALFVTWLFLRYEKRSFKEIGLAWQSGTPGRFLKGLIIGSALFSVALLASLLLTPLQIQRNTKTVDYIAILGYLAFLPLSLLEEIAFRAYPFTKLHQRFGLRMTQVIIAVAFVLWHVVGGQSVFGSFLGPGVYAFVFGLAAVWSGGIALPFGINVVLNILQPLTGMRGDAGAVWTLSQKSNVVNDSMAAPETIGLVIQLVVLVAAILLTEYYIRTKGNHPAQNESTNSIMAKNPDFLETDFLQKPKQVHNSSFQK
jgi:membrane protease YdiL (CAAX protease family)